MRKSSRLPVEDLQPYLLETAWSSRFEIGERRGVSPTWHAATLADPTLPLTWSEVFANPRPVEIEVGCGKGLFLLNASQARPEVNFLGIEIERKYALFTATRLAKRRLPNVKVACCDGRWFLRTHVRDVSVQAVHVYFPDPWWKNKHRKRRLFTMDFAAQATRVLQPGGRLHLATDVEDYFTETLSLLAGLPELREQPRPPAHEPRHDQDYLTNFERKYRRAGLPIFGALFEKTGF